jgi:hypothetical protein
LSGLQAVLPVRSGPALPASVTVKIVEASALLSYAAARWKPKGPLSSAAFEFLSFQYGRSKVHIDADD